MNKQKEDKPKCPICGAFLRAIAPTEGSQTYGMAKNDYECTKCKNSGNWKLSISFFLLNVYNRKGVNMASCKVKLQWELTIQGADSSYSEGLLLQGAVQELYDAVFKSTRKPKNLTYTIECTK